MVLWLLTAITIFPCPELEEIKLCRPESEPLCCSQQKWFLLCNQNIHIPALPASIILHRLVDIHGHLITNVFEKHARCFLFFSENIVKGISWLKGVQVQKNAVFIAFLYGKTRLEETENKLLPLPPIFSAVLLATEEILYNMINECLAGYVLELFNK